MPVSELGFKKLLIPAGANENRFFRGDWTLNLYRGCNHGCIYCDSRSVCYHMDDFGRVRVKKDCLASLETELRSKKRSGVVGMGAASDAYNALEAELQVTRGALLRMRRYGFGVFIPTKSELITRDADLLGDMARQGYACVAFSITTGDGELASLLEPCAPSPEKRFAAMRKLAVAGVLTGTWMNPMLPFLTDTEENVREVLRRTADAGGRFAVCHFAVTLREGDREYFYQALNEQPRFAGISARYTDVFGLSYICVTPDAQRLSAVFDEECDRLGLLRDFASVNHAAGVAEPVQTCLFGSGREA